MRQHETVLWPNLLFVLSGAAALVLEAVFLRQLAWLFGNSAAATALVLAAFMAGLAIGSLAFGGLADRSPRPLRVFALLELGTAGSAALLAWLLGEGREWFLAPIRAVGSEAARSFVEFLLAFALLLIPTTLMGGTLPALSRFVIRRMDGFVGSLGLLYGANTLGAAAGVFVAGFYLFEYAGISASAYLAASAQVCVGLTALLLSRTLGAAGAPPATPTPSPTPTPAAFDRGTRAACLLAATAGGLAVLGYEVTWTRLLTLPMRSFSYSFSLMLSLFLLGLCIGAVGVWLVGPRLDRPIRWVGWLQLAMGLYVAASVFWMPALLSPLGASTFERFLGLSAIRAAAIVLPPTVLSGMVLPIAARGFAREAGRVGGDVGVVYALNTAGAIAGSLFAGLVLLPTVGAPRTLAVLALANGSAGAIVVTQQFGRRAWQTWTAATLAAVALLPLAAAGSGRYVEAFLAASRGSSGIAELLFFHEGATDTVAIVRKDYGFHDPQAKSLITNGIAMSATVKPVWRYMSVEGHLPLLFAAEPRRALAVGVGTGITLDALVSHPALERIVAVELSEGVMRGLKYFEQENSRAFDDPRVELIREDGRHYLELTESRFDVITLEPPPPIVAGSVHLYSLDFYRLCLARLTAGGVVAQWLPLHAQSLASARMVAATFVEAFPHAMLWLPSVRDAVLIGARRPLGLDLDRLQAAYGTPGTRKNLEAAYLETPEALLATYLLDRAGIEQWAAGASVITDDRPLMEFFRHQGANMTDADTTTLLEPPQAGWDWLRDAASDPGLLDRIEDENRAMRQYVRAAALDDQGLRVAAARRSRATEFHLYGLGCASAQLDFLRASSGAPAERVETHVQRCAALSER
ncbi:MAG TPA: fused MFS/spermidine synthase [Candidatus Polarisedimenticolaceae bacterium]|nr:fused MFS/spermidine synthase [Candidatus Polarisedimenticolaceae bacterium]